jgi:CarboxypepD_reg-like domain
MISLRRLSIIAYLAAGGCNSPSSGHRAESRDSDQTHSEMVNDYVLQGRVYDMRGEPLPYAAILVEGTAQMTRTDSLGRFTLTEFPEQLSGIQVRKEGYRAAECPLSGELKLKRLRCNVSLQPTTDTMPVAVSSLSRSDSASLPLLRRGLGLKPQPRVTISVNPDDSLRAR